MPITIDRPDIRPSGDKLLDFVKKLENMILDAEEYRGTFDTEREKNWNFYNCVPDQVTKTWPWQNASNLFAPLVRTQVNSLAAQFYDAMLANRPRIVGKVDPLDEMKAQLLDQFYFDYIFETVIPLKSLGDMWNKDTLIDGVGVVMPRWNREMCVYRYDNETEEPVMKRLTTEILGEQISTEIPTGEVNISVREMPQLRVKQGPVVDHIDLFNLYVAPGTRSTLQHPDCDWYYEVRYMTPSELLAKKRYDNWDNIDEDLLARAQEPPVNEIEANQRSDMGLSEEKGRPSLRVLVFYMREVLPAEVRDPESGKAHSQSFMDEEGYPEECIVYYLCDAKDQDRRIASIVPLTRIHPDGRRPHIDNHYSLISNTWYTKGVAYVLQDMNRLINSSYNQMVDYGTLQNIPFGFYEPAATGLLPNLFRLAPGVMNPVQNANRITFPRLQGNPMFWSQLAQIGLMWTEKETSVTDFTQGRSSAMPNQSRTYRGMSMLMQASNLTFSYATSLMAQRYKEMFRCVHQLYRRHAPRDIEFVYFNKNAGLFTRANMQRDVLDTEVDFEFQLTPNRQQDQQTAQLMLQTLAPVLQVVNPAGLRELYRTFWEAFGKKNFDAIWPPNPAPQQPVMAGQQGQPSALNGGMQAQLNPIAPIPEPTGGIIQ